MKRLGENQYQTQLPITEHADLWLMSQQNESLLRNFKSFTLNDLFVLNYDSMLHSCPQQPHKCLSELDVIRKTFEKLLCKVEDF